MNISISNDKPTSIISSFSYIAYKALCISHPAFHLSPIFLQPLRLSSRYSKANRAYSHNLLSFLFLFLRQAFLSNIDFSHPASSKQMDTRLRQNNILFWHRHFLLFNIIKQSVYLSIYFVKGIINF